MSARARQSDHEPKCRTQKCPEPTAEDQVIARGPAPVVTAAQNRDVARPKSRPDEPPDQGTPSGSARRVAWCQSSHCWSCDVRGWRLGLQLPSGLHLPTPDLRPGRGLRRSKSHVSSEKRGNETAPDYCTQGGERP